MAKATQKILPRAIAEVIAGSTRVAVCKKYNIHPCTLWRAMRKYESQGQAS